MDIEPKKVLLIIQRSNGDVYYSYSLLRILSENYPNTKFDYLINDDTYSIAKTFDGVNKIIQFSYKLKRANGLNYIYKFSRQIFRKYDLSINLTASDRSVFLAIISAKKSISVVDQEKTKSWWKKLLLSHYYKYNPQEHILRHTLKALKFLKIKYKEQFFSPPIHRNALLEAEKKLNDLGIKKFIIFHPSAQYEYKVSPKKFRNEFLKKMSSLNIDIVITGGNTEIDRSISKSLPNYSYLHNFIGKTSLELFQSLCSLCDVFIGMDTLNAHIAASFKKQIFLISGPTELQRWIPWTKNDTVEVVLADMPCVPCGKKGCNNEGRSMCLEVIQPETLLNKICLWYEKNR